MARWPLLAEPTSGARFGTARIDAYRLILPTLADRVERVVVYGRPTLSRPVTSLLDDARVQVIQVVRHPDDLGPGRDVVRVGAVTVTGSDDPAWLYDWAEAGLTRSMDAIETIDAWPVVTGLHVAQAIAAATRPDDALFVGSSNAVRDLDLVAAELPRDALIVANRGLAGIDGAISTAIGVAIASGRPTRAYLGDLTLLHDINGLAIPEIERDRLRLQIVVANDDGGGIFATLEHASHPEAFERVFATPIGADLASLCAGYGILHRMVQLADLTDALADIPLGVTVVEVATSRSNLARLHAGL
jgi:2-succinyl-5-enolpyruvyl-6-hydroxy-3-cyclohexene-1-carboxylate synthase